MSKKRIGQRSKSVDQLPDVRFDLLIIVCDNAASNCPLWLGSGQVKHIGCPDPAAASGNVAERLRVFRQVQDSLRQEVFAYLEHVESVEMEAEFYAPREL